MNIKNYRTEVLLHEAGHAVAGISLGLEFKKITLTPAPPSAKFKIPPYEVTNLQLISLRCAGRIAEKLLSQKTGQSNTPGSGKDDADIKLVNDFLDAFHGSLTKIIISSAQAKIENVVLNFLDSHWGACEAIATHLDRYGSLSKKAMGKIQQKHRF